MVKFLHEYCDFLSINILIIKVFYFARIIKTHLRRMDEMRNY